MTRCLRSCGVLGSKLMAEIMRYTLRQILIEKFKEIIEWTLEDGSLKSADHSHCKRLAEEALLILEPPLDRVPGGG